MAAAPFSDPLIHLLQPRYQAQVRCPTCQALALFTFAVDRTSKVTRLPDGKVEVASKGPCPGCSSLVTCNLQVEVPLANLRPPPATGESTRPKTADDEGERDLLEANSDTVELTKDVFSEYRCRSLDYGCVHPSDNITESASMSGVLLPPALYPLQQALGSAVETGLLSNLQLEGTLYACQRHLRFLPGAVTPTRYGFFLGDGAGVGKGRQIAATILDNFMRGRRKHVWFSVSSDLRLDAERDLKDIGAEGISVIDGCKGLDKGKGLFGTSSTTKDGVVFSTYATLVSAVQQQASKVNSGAKRQKTRRLDQLIDWCGGAEFEGCLVFDECHKAKNYKDGSDQGSKVGAAVVELQKALPRARVLYCSATGVTDLENMAYMERLGLWGPGTQFDSFNDFFVEMKNRGVGALEMLAIEMKASGGYVSRALGFKSAEFDVLEAELSHTDKTCYDNAAAFWDEVRKQLQIALSETQGSNTVMRSYWSAHQRFFKQLCISMKMQKITEEAQAALNAGHCVVIGLQTTGESALEDHLAKSRRQSLGVAEQFNGFISVTQFILCSFIETHFPTAVVAQRLEPASTVQCLPGGQELLSDGTIRNADGSLVATNMPPPPVPQEQTSLPRPHLVDLKVKLLKRAKELVLPPSPLDYLVDQLGGPANVAEMTGRKGRLVRLHPDSDKTKYVERGKADEERETLNVQECRDFQSGRKLVGIISDAASTGISLHASTRAGNGRRRVHITMEMPWSADKAIQQLGRSHRSNQLSAPHYKLVISALAGERRFAAAVARRLESLGALTRGDRRAATGADLSQFNFDTKYGRTALKKLLTAVSFEQQPPAGVDLTAIVAGTPLEGLNVSDIHSSLVHTLQQIGLLDEGPGANVPVTKFLNRLLGAPVGMQNVLFGYYTAIFDADISQARRTGVFNEGVSDIKGKVSLLKDPEILYTNATLGIETTLHSLSVDRGLSFMDAKAMLENARSASGGKAAVTEQADDDELDGFIEDDEDDGDGEDDNQTGFYRSRSKVFGEYIHLLAISKKVNGWSKCVVSRPNTGTNKNDAYWSDIKRKYQRYADEDMERAQTDWEEEYARGGSANAKVKRKYTVGVLTGSVTPFWGTLERLISDFPELGYSQADSQLQVVRIELDGGQRIVGVKWPIELAGEVGTRLDAAAANKVAAAHAVEAVAPIDLPSAKRAAKKAQQTMTSFFSAASASASAMAVAAAAPTAIRKSAQKKQQKSISAFFGASQRVVDTDVWKFR